MGGELVDGLRAQYLARRSRLESSDGAPADEQADDAAGADRALRRELVSVAAGGAGPFAAREADRDRDRAHAGARPRPRGRATGMTRRNRATPRQEVIADPARGLVYANRGVLVDAHGEIRRRWGVRRWIACRLEFKGRRRRPLMAPGRYTELFFTDEATAFAAGHRPCGECRYEDYRRFSAIWQRLHPGQVGADAMDDQLHAERVDPETRAQRHHEMPFDGLARRDVRALGRAAVAGAGRPASGVDPGGLRRRAPRASARRDRGGAHAAVARRCAPLGMGAGDGAVPAPDGTE